MKVKIYNLSELPTADFEDFKELQGDFKIQTDVQFGKLKKTIIDRGFKYSFKAWKDRKGNLWILDAHQRKKVLKSLRDSGYEIGPVPYELIYAKNKKEAIEELLYINSRYGDINRKTTVFKEWDIDIMEHYAEIPELKFDNLTEWDKSEEKQIPEMELQPYEHWDYIVLMFRDQHDFMNALNKFGIKKVNYSQVSNKKVGLGRVIDGSRALKKLTENKR